MSRTGQFFGRDEIHSWLQRSPVFVYINPTLARPPNWGLTPMKPTPIAPSSTARGFLGSLVPPAEPFPTPLGDKRTKVKPDQFVEINTGMAGVTPAWRTRDLLELEEFQM